MGSQSSKLVTDAQLKHEHAINYMNSGGSMSDKSGQSLQQQDTHKDNKDIVNTVFKWNFGGQKVFVTGTFTQWKNPIQLQRDKGGEFGIVLPLPRGVYHYKFIVDGEWRFSPDDMTSPDEHGNINNMIDTTQVDNTLNFMDNSKQQYFQKSNEKDIPAQGNHQQIQFINNLNVDMQNSGLGIQKQATTTSDLNFSDQAPPVPPHLLKFYYVEEKEKKLEKMWNQSQKGEMEEEGQQKARDTFDCLIQLFSNVNSLSAPPHVTLNHLGVMSSNNKSSYPYNVYILSHRFKAKYTTIKFFTHKYSENKQQQLYVI